MGWIENVNAKVATSVVGKWFRLDGSGHVGLPRSPSTFVMLCSVRGKLWCFMFPVLSPDAGLQIKW
jgi:AGZA family xanthine/uracil permease-like MFS transporter